MNWKKLCVVVAAVVVAVLSVVWLMSRPSHPPAPSVPSENAGEAVRVSGGREGVGPVVSGDVSPLATAHKARRSEMPKPAQDLPEDAEDDEEARRTPEDRKLAADIERALDEEDFELAKKCAPLALVCKDVSIRQSMVDTLGWFGAGDEFTDRAAAEKWIAEEYEPPESDDK